MNSMSRSSPAFILMYISFRFTCSELVWVCLTLLCSFTSALFTPMSLSFITDTFELFTQAVGSQHWTLRPGTSDVWFDLVCSLKCVSVGLVIIHVHMRMQQNHSGHSEVTRPLLDSRNLPNECFILFIWINKINDDWYNWYKKRITISSSEVCFDL